MLIRRKIELTVQLSRDTGTAQPTKFAESGSSSIQISGLRTSVEIVNSGTPVGCEAYVRVWGVRQSLMNQLSTLGLVFNLVPRNTLSIAVGDAESGLSTIFNGTIREAYADYSAQPDVPFVMVCTLLGTEAVAPAKPSSFKSSADVATVVSGLARQLGMGFENNGVSIKLSRPYLYGSLRDQVDRICRHAGVAWAVVNGNTLAIWPRDKNRTARGSVPVISPENGMVGYPAFTQQGIIVKTVFNPQIAVGALVEVRSSLLSGIGAAAPQVNFPTQWAINKVDLQLESEVPNGDWLMTLYAYNPGFSRTIIPPAR